MAKEVQLNLRKVATINYEYLLAELHCIITLIVTMSKYITACRVSKRYHKVSDLRNTIARCFELKIIIGVTFC
jgi:hypothetical protein